MNRGGFAGGTPGGGFACSLSLARSARLALARSVFLLSAFGPAVGLPPAGFAGPSGSPWALCVSFSLGLRLFPAPLFSWPAGPVFFVVDGPSWPAVDARGWSCWTGCRFGGPSACPRARCFRRRRASLARRRYPGLVLLDRLPVWGPAASGFGPRCSSGWAFRLVSWGRSLGPVGFPPWLFGFALPVPCFRAQVLHSWGVRGCTVVLRIALSPPASRQLSVPCHAFCPGLPCSRGGALLSGVTLSAVTLRAATGQKAHHKARRSIDCVFVFIGCVLPSVRVGAGLLPGRVLGVLLWPPTAGLGATPAQR